MSALASGPALEDMLRANFLAPSARANPYPFYAQIRDYPPFYSETLGGWIVSRYADVLAVFRDRRIGHNQVRPPENGEPLPPVKQIQSRWLVFLNPPDHTRLRTLVSKGFSPRVVEQMHGRIQQITDGLIDEALAAGSFDLLNDLAAPLPMTVVAELLGVPIQDRRDFKVWGDDVLRAFDAVPSMGEGWRRANEAVAAFTRYLSDLVAERRRQPQDDLLSSLLAVEEAGDQLSEDDLLATCILLIVAGQETTMNLICNGVLALITHPEQQALLRAQPDLIGAAVEEMLRYDSPVQLTRRTVLEQTEVGGATLPPGQHVFVLVGSANRDPAQFVEPERFDIGRRDNKHLSFAHGMHYCLGAPLSRLEAQVAIGTLLRRAPALSVAAEGIEWNNHIALRGVKELPLRLDRD